MPNNTVRAGGEAMPESNRRHFLLNTAIIGAAVAVAVPAAAGARSIHDPLLDAIETYRRGIADFNAKAPMGDDDLFDAYADISWKPAMRRLEEWTEPARTLRGAIEAVRFAYEETTTFEASPMVQPVLAAAIAYFEREAV
jgi:hypothetical protein